MNQDTTTTQQGATTQPEGNGATAPEKPTQGKTFTQEEVNRIVSDRLTKEREKTAQATQEDEREQGLKAREANLAKAEFGMAATKAMADLKFTSPSAKRMFLTDLAEKGLSLQDGAIVGFEDFLTEFQASDPEAFMREGEKVPTVTRGTGGGRTIAADAIAQAFKPK